MTICRYYVQGTCRFGDRCRFEHIDSNYDSYNNYNQRNVGNYQERYGRQDTGRTIYRNDNQYTDERYEQKGYYAVNQRSYSPNRYSENYHYEPSRYSTYDNQYQSRSRQGYEQQPRYNEQNYGRNQQYTTKNYQTENAYGQNRFQWHSENYKKETHQNVEHTRNDYANDTYNTSTPKGKVSFSFKVPESEIKKPSNSLFQVNDQDQLRINIIKEDAKAWELGGQWPFTCYFPAYKHGFPGFYDVSPEELRYAAYKAEKNNSYETYVQAVHSAVVEVNALRSQLQIPTPELLSLIRQIWNGEDLYSASNKINPISLMECKETPVENMETPAVLASTDSTSSFNFKMATDVDSSAKTNPANFSFKLPAGTEIKPVTSISDGDPGIYTPLEKLTDEEKEQFSASTFVLGKIPTKPPSRVLCI